MSEQEVGVDGGKDASAVESGSDQDSSVSRRDVDSNDDGVSRIQDDKYEEIFSAAQWKVSTQKKEAKPQHTEIDAAETMCLHFDEKESVLHGGSVQGREATLNVTWRGEGNAIHVPLEAAVQRHSETAEKPKKRKCGFVLPIASFNSTESKTRDTSSGEGWVDDDGGEFISYDDVWVDPRHKASSSHSRSHK